MARARNKFNAKEVAALAAPGRHSDGGGLYLLIDGIGDAQRRRWLFLFRQSGKRREMGLGPYPAVSLAEARKARDAAERVVREGADPIVEREAARRAAAPKPTFGEVADALIAAKSREWRSKRHADQWRASLGTLAAPLRDKPVDEIDTAAVLACLKPAWIATPETASRTRQRIEAVIDAATAQGLRSGENPARWRGNLAHLLPRRPALSKSHHAAMPFADVPAFVAKLREHQARSVAAAALELLIITAARSGEVYGATWAEIDFGGRVWIVPASRMKGGREHRVPLCERAVEILREMAALREGQYVFVGRSDGHLSHVAMQKVLERLGVEGATVHGFRSSFRDWCGDATSFSRELAEASLAHVVGGVEGAYRRSDALEKRRALMEAWARHCEPSTGDNVIALPSRQGARA